MFRGSKPQKGAAERLRIRQMFERSAAGKNAEALPVSGSIRDAKIGLVPGRGSGMVQAALARVSARA